MFIRSKVVKGETYYQAVETYRDKETGHVRHRTVASLGRWPMLAEALQAEQRLLSHLRRKRTKFHAEVGLAEKTSVQERRGATLERRIAAAAAKIETLASLVAREQSRRGAVDTTNEPGIFAVPEDSGVVSTIPDTADADYERTAEAVAKIMNLSIETVKQLRHLREHAPDIAEEFVASPDNAGWDGKKFAGFQARVAAAYRRAVDRKGRARAVVSTNHRGV